MTFGADREARTCRALWAALAAAAVLWACGSRAQESPPPSLNLRLFTACTRGQVEEVRSLLMAGADPSGHPAPDDPHLVTPLVGAATYGHSAVVELLLQAGARTTGPGEPGLQALNMALFGSNQRTQERTQKSREEAGKTPIPRGTGYLEIVHLLLEAGVPPDARNDFGLTPLHGAAMYGNLPAVDLLLDHGASVDLCPESGGTPLELAALEGYGEVVARLLKADAEPNRRDAATGATPLLQAASGGSHEALARISGGRPEGFGYVSKIEGSTHLLAVQALLKAGAEPDLADRKGFTPLMSAALAGKVEILRVLLDAAANPALADETGRTALHFAAASGKAPVVQLLLERGADPKAVTLEGETVLQSAQSGKDRETIKVVKRALSR